MAQVRRITVVGEDVLHRPCREVVEFGAGELAELVEDMFLTMRIAEGAGLAANQVGVDLRLFVYDCRDETGARHVGHVCNPVLEQQKVRRLADDKEGCLSVPGPYLRLARPDHAVVHGFDISGSPVTVEGRGYFARCLQHETDHLNGHIYLDRLPEKTRRQALKEMAEKRAAIFTRRAARAAEHATNRAIADKAGCAVEQMEGWTGEEAKGRANEQVEVRRGEQEGRTGEQFQAQAGERAEGRAGGQVEAQTGEQAKRRASGQVAGRPGVGSVEGVVGR